MGKIIPFPIVSKELEETSLFYFSNEIEMRRWINRHASRYIDDYTQPAALSDRTVYVVRFNSTGYREEMGYHSLTKAKV